MSTPRRRSIVVILATFVFIALGIATPSSHVAADDDGPNPDEGSDIAIPGVVPDRQVTSGPLPAPRAATERVLPAIDDFAYDSLITVGTAAEVCHGGLRQGTLGTFNELTRRFGGAPGTLYSCRERYAVHERPECNGQVASSPALWSDCWSNHAQGRALDVMVGSAGGGYDEARGNAIVNFLLATDSAGNVNANARRLGVQQILWNDRCWNSDGDRGITTVAGMRPCGIGHFDHVHVDLSINGAEARTSWWGFPPQRSPTLNSLWYRDTESGIWQWQTWINWGLVATNAGSMQVGFTKMIGGDWNGDGTRDEIFAWNPTSGAYHVYDGTTGHQYFFGIWSTAFDQFVPGDFDSDGFMNDMIVFDTETGTGEMWTWWAGGTVKRGGDWGWVSGWQIVALDANSDGVVGETFLYNPRNGHWWVFGWSGPIPIYMRSGFFLNIWDNIVAGDLDAQGNSDDLYVRDQQTGVWVVLNWSGLANPVQSAIGTWLTAWDHVVIGDWDTDGRLDDMFLRDDHSGYWTMLSWHRFVPVHVIVAQWLPSLDTWLSGTFG